MVSEPTCFAVSAPAWVGLKACSSVEVRLPIWVAVKAATWAVVNRPCWVVVRLPKAVESPPIWLVDRRVTSSA